MSSVFHSSSTLTVVARANCIFVYRGTRITDQPTTVRASASLLNSIRLGRISEASPALAPVSDSEALAPEIGDNGIGVVVTGLGEKAQAIAGIGAALGTAAVAGRELGRALGNALGLSDSLSGDNHD